MEKAEVMPNAGFSTAIEEIVKSRSATAVDMQKIELRTANQPA
jgi:hypothetical protein